MLLRFNVENFLSFNSMSEFSLIANKERRKSTHYVEGKGVKILKTGIVYGANASGKSNLVKAIDFSKKIIVKGIDKVDTANRHYKLNAENAEKPSIFQYEIKVGEKYYSYGFAVVLKSSKIIEEWMYEVGKGVDKKIFERTIDDEGRHIIDIGLKLSSNAKNRFEVYKQDFYNSDNYLFLSEINRKSIKGLKEAEDFFNVYNWFSQKLTVIFPESKFSGLNFIGDDKTMAKTFKEFLSFFQTGINGITTEEVDLENFDIPERIKQDLTKHIEENKQVIFGINGIIYSLRHSDKNIYKVKKIGLEHLDTKNNPMVFDMNEESDGTQRLFDFIPALHELTKTDSVYVVDEIDRSLHSKLTYTILEGFIKLGIGRESQLIATTHESLLLDLNLLRRDEIWFVEKQEGESKLYSLDEFKVRNDKIVSKDYLLGRYGAIPIFKNFENLEL